MQKEQVGKNGNGPKKNTSSDRCQQGFVVLYNRASPLPLPRVLQARCMYMKAVETTSRLTTVSPSTFLWPPDALPASLLMAKAAYCRESYAASSTDPTLTSPARDVPSACVQPRCICMKPLMDLCA
jgi:hypothetical protein